MKLASIFQDGAVLQRNTTIPVWGNAACDSIVCGTLNGTATYSRTSATGDFMLYFPPQTAGGPYSLEVVCNDEKIVLNNILIGELWLASGQSNMRYRLGDDLRPDKIDAEKQLSRQQEKEFFETLGSNSILRCFTVEPNASSCCETTCRGSWKTIDPDCSAVASWFGLYLQKQLDIPVGLIVSSWGGTIAEAWSSSSALRANPKTRHLTDILRASHLKEKTYTSTTANSQFSDAARASLRPDTTNEGFEKGFHTVDFDDSAWTTMKIPGSWIKQYISGNGAVWIRNRIEIPQAWIGKEIFLCTGGIDKQDISYFNGQEIGRTGSGASMNTYGIPREYRIPAELNNSATALIAVRGYSCCFDGSFCGAWRLENRELGETLDICGIWKAGVELDLGPISLRRDTSSFGPGVPNTPSILFDGMIRPLIPAALAGVIWYQGESNANSIPNAIDYQDTLKYMINDWRYHFQAPELPFIQVQLANYGMPGCYNSKAAWPYLRESQRNLCSLLPNCAMATAVDIGEEVDIHPQDKQTVGFRLAACALNKVYGFTDIVPNGPELLRAVNEAPGVVRLDFAWADGLRIDDEAEQCFYVSADGENFTAVKKAEVQGASVVLYSEEPLQIKCVRYAWSDNPTCTLYNGDGFPASPFSADL